MDNSATMFERLPPANGERPRQPDIAADRWKIVQPAPADAPPVTFRHPEFVGQPSLIWEYRDADGRRLGYVCRFELAHGNKDYRPYTLWRDEEGRMQWRWKSWPTPRPLYGLDKLAAQPDAPVLVVEGEKAADAASKLWPDRVATSPPHGAQSPHTADWSPVSGRTVIVWPDADGSGRDFASKVAGLCCKAGAASVRVVDVPHDWPDGWDLADELPPGWDTEALRRLSEAAKSPETSVNTTREDPGVRYPFGLNELGVFYFEKDDDGETPPEFVCSRLEVLGVSRDADGYEWGRLVAVVDPDGQRHEWALPMSMLAGDGADYRAELLRMGLILAPTRKARDRLHTYISTTQSTTRVRCVSRTGWHGPVYVLADTTYGADSERVILQTAAPAEHRTRTSGTLGEWKQEIGTLCIGNSRLAFALSCAFAAPLLYLADEESGGFHLRGPSSIGKTTALRVAGSAWGGGGVNGYVTAWRATANGLEAVAAAHCDGLLCLDELGQVAACEAGEAAYMLANGSGKSRARRDGTARAPASWRVLGLSTGEPSLADRMREAGQRVHAGQETRLVDISADVGTGMGVFEVLHGFDSAERLARHLRDATGRLYGVAIREYLARITADVGALADALRAARRRWVDANCPAGADGQVERVAARFGLVAAAGALATTMQLLPWPEGEAERAAAACFGSWLTARGGIGSTEITMGIAQVRRFIEAHGASRFQRHNDAAQLVANRAGFVRDDGNGHVEYLIMPGAWREELCEGYDPGAIARALSDAGHLVPDSDGKPCRRERVPALRKTTRVYRLRASILGEGGDDA